MASVLNAGHIHEFPNKLYSKLEHNFLHLPLIPFTNDMASDFLN